mmetsp:Transcript_30663/g.99727  ORF Transcript_30663/g.99727 Transcript_30663/m.99727 type:complete len:226 (-) Transcript_30663:52-729(-)
MSGIPNSLLLGIDGWVKITHLEGQRGGEARQNTMDKSGGRFLRLVRARRGVARLLEPVLVRGLLFLLVKVLNLVERHGRLERAPEKVEIAVGDLVVHLHAVKLLEPAHKELKPPRENALPEVTSLLQQNLQEPIGVRWWNLRREIVQPFVVRLHRRQVHLLQLRKNRFHSLERKHLEQVVSHRSLDVALVLPAEIRSRRHTRGAGEATAEASMTERAGGGRAESR